MEAKDMKLLYELYPFAMDFDAELPTYWNSKDKHVYIKLSHDNRRAQYKGPGKNHKDAAAIRANFPIPPICGLYYYEVTVLNKGRDGYIGIGLSEGNVCLNRLPGWEKRSYGYHGDDGNSFLSCGIGVPYGPTYTTGDVVGCGVNFEDRTCFYTKNGQNLGVVFKDLPLNLFPVVGLQTPGEVVEVNFGHAPFVYDIKKDIEEIRCHMWQKLRATPLSDSKIDWIRSLVSSYLVHQAYPRAASAFGKFSDIKINESLESIGRRHAIRVFIVHGQLSRAVDLLNTYYSQLLASDPQLKFVLMCSLFCELLTANSDERHLLSEVDFPDELFPFVELDSPIQSPSRQLQSNQSLSDRAETASPIDSAEAQSQFMETASLVDSESDVSTVDGGDNNPSRNGSEIRRYGNGIVEVEMSCDMASAEREHDDQGSDHEGTENSSNLEALRNSISRCSSSCVAGDNELTISEMTILVSFGHFISKWAKRLQTYNLFSNELLSIMMDTFALMAYDNPKSSPYAYLLSQQRRISLSVIVNSAILNWNGDSKLSELEQLFTYASHLRDLLKEASVVSAAFLDPNEFLHNSH